jgi:hypothetical protein
MNAKIEIDTEELSKEIVQHIDLHDLAKQIEAGDIVRDLVCESRFLREIAQEIEISDLAAEFCADDIAREIDPQEVAEHIDLEDLAGRFDIEEVARHVPRGDLVTALIVTDELKALVREAVQEQLKDVLAALEGLTSKQQEEPKDKTQLKNAIIEAIKAL